MTSPKGFAVRHFGEAEQLYILFKSRKKWNSGILENRKLFGADQCTSIFVVHTHF